MGSLNKDQGGGTDTGEYTYTWGRRRVSSQGAFPYSLYIYRPGAPRRKTTKLHGQRQYISIASVALCISVTRAGKRKISGVASLLKVICLISSIVGPCFSVLSRRKSGPRQDPNFLLRTSWVYICGPGKGACTFVTLKLYNSFSPAFLDSRNFLHGPTTNACISLFRYTHAI